MPRRDNDTATSARTRLSAAIVEVNRAQEYVARVNTARNRLSSRIHAALGAVDDAEAKAKKAHKGSSSEAAVAALLRDEAPPPSTIKQAEQALEAEQAALADLEGQRVLLDEEARIAANELGKAADRRDAAITDVLRQDPGIAALIGERDASRRRIIELERALSVIAGRFPQAVPPGWNSIVQRQPDPGLNALSDEWLKALDNLSRDSGTAIPRVLKIERTILRPEPGRSAAATH